MFNFSIVIPIYPPHAHYVQRILNEIDNFEGEDILEVIFAMSETLSYNEPYNSKYNVVFECTSEKCNAAKNRNRGWDKAKGEWVVFLDADDLYHPLKLKITANAIYNNLGTQCVIHNYVYRNKNFPAFDPEKYEVTTNDIIKNCTLPAGWVDGSNLRGWGATNLNFGKAVQHGIATVRRDINMRYNESYSRGEDGYFCRSVCWFIGGLIHIDLPLTIHIPIG